MAYLAAIDWLALVIFTALMLTIAMFGLCFSGQFPAEHRKPEFRGWHGKLIMVVTVLVIAICATRMLGLAIERIAAPAAIIGGGVALLAAPLVLRMFPDSFVDGRAGLAALSATAAALTMLVGRLLV